MVPHCAAAFDAGAPEQSAEAILPQLIPDASSCSVQDGTLRVAPVLGGLTNKLFTVAFRARTVLVRVYGDDGMIDRAAETQRFIALAEAGLGPTCYGTFGNGRLEHFFEGFRTLCPKDLADPKRSQKIAEQLALSHRAIPLHQCADALGAGGGLGGGGGGSAAQAATGDPEPSLWPQLSQWMKGAKTAAFPAGSQEAADYRSVNLTHAERHIQVAPAPSLMSCTSGRGCGTYQSKPGRGVMLIVRARAYAWTCTCTRAQELRAGVKPDWAIVFCHNDLLAANILEDPGTGDLKLIDFEYGGANYRLRGRQTSSTCARQRWCLHSRRRSAALYLNMHAFPLAPSLPRSLAPSLPTSLRPGPHPGARGGGWGCAGVRGGVW